MHSPALNPGSSTIGQELHNLGAVIDQHQNAAINARQIRRCRAAYLGDFYGDTPMPAWKEPKCHPKVNEVVENFAAILTENEPKFAPKKRDSGNTVLSSVFFAASDYEWERQKMQTKMMVQARALLIDGSCFFYTGVNGNDRGNPFTKVLSAFSVALDPFSDNDEDAGYAKIKYSVSKAEIEAAFGSMAGKIFDTCSGAAVSKDDDDDTYKVGPDADRRNFGRPQLGTLGGNPTEIITPMEADSHRYTARYGITEWWFAKGSERELNLMLMDGSKSLLKAPGKHGRRIILIDGHYFSKLDTDSPFDHGEIPITRFNAITHLGEAYGYPYILPLLDLAEEIADLDNIIRWNAKLMMNPLWFVPLQSGVNVKKLTSAPAMVVPYRHPFKPEAHVPPPLPSYVFEHRKNKEKEFDRAGGMGDIDHGQYSGGLADVAGKAVQELSKPAKRRMIPLQRSIEEGLPRWGRQTLCNAVQFWPRDRWLSVVDADIAADELMNPGSVLPWLTPGYKKPADSYVPEIRMSVGSNLPVDSNAKNVLAFRLHDAGAFGVVGEPETEQLLLEATSFPEVEKAIEAIAVTKERLFKMQNPAPTPPPGAPPMVEGENKALGGEASPASQMTVAGTPEGQEVPS